MPAVLVNGARQSGKSTLVQSEELTRHRRQNGSESFGVNADLKMPMGWTGFAGGSGFLLQQAYRSGYIKGNFVKKMNYLRLLDSIRRPISKNEVVIV
jgi:hypothetical protein